MFFYFPLKQKGGAVIGRVRIENKKASYTLTRPVRADAYLFADGKILPLRENEAVSVESPEALIGVENAELVFFGLAPGATQSPEQLLYRLSQNSTISAKAPAPTPDDSPVPEMSFPADPKNIEHYGADSSHIDSDKEPAPKLNPLRFEEDAFEQNPLFFHAVSVYSRLDGAPAFTAAQPSSPASFHDNIPNMVHDSTDKPADFINRHTDMVQKECIITDQAIEAAHESPLLRWEQSDARLPKIDLFPRIFPNAVWRFVARDGMPPHFEGLWTHNGERIRILAVRGAYDKQPPKGLSGFTRYLRTDGAGYWVRLIPLGRTR